MGDFKPLCAVSGAVISPKEKVMLFFIASDKNKGYHNASTERGTISKGTLCNVYDDFKIISGVGIEATYDTDGYGTYNFSEKSIKAQLILNEIKSVYIENKKNKFEDVKNEKHFNIKKEKLNLKTIQKMINSGDLYVRSIAPNMVNFVSFMPVLMSVYKMMINDPTEVLDRVSLKYKTLNFNDQLNIGFNKFLEWKEKVDEEKRKPRYYDNLYKDLKFSESDIDELKTSSAQFIVPFGLDHERNYIYNGVNSLFYLLKTFKEENEKNILDIINEGKLFSEKLQEYNIMIRPTMIASSDHFKEDRISFLNKIIKCIEKDIK